LPEFVAAFCELTEAVMGAEVGPRAGLREEACDGATGAVSHDRPIPGLRRHVRPTAAHRGRRARETGNPPMGPMPRIEVSAQHANSCRCLPN
jgi:hypothetical protein